MKVLAGTNAENEYRYNYAVVADDSIASIENSIAAFRDLSDLQLFLAAKGQPPYVPPTSPKAETK